MKEKTAPLLDGIGAFRVTQLSTDSLRNQYAVVERRKQVLLPDEYQIADRGSITDDGHGAGGLWKEGWPAREAAASGQLLPSGLEGRLQVFCQLLLGVVQKRPPLLEKGFGLHTGLVTEQRADLPERERAVAVPLSGHRFEGASGEVPPLLLEAAGKVFWKREGHVHGSESRREQ